MLADLLGKPNPFAPVVMPERLALTEPSQQVTEIIGSGPYKFVMRERVPGSLAVYERYADYVPRTDGPPVGTAGPKIAYFDRVEWHTIPDAVDRRRRAASRRGRLVGANDGGPAAAAAEGRRM